MFFLSHQQRTSGLRRKHGGQTWQRHEIPAAVPRTGQIPQQECLRSWQSVLPQSNAMQKSHYTCAVIIFPRSTDKTQSNTIPHTQVSTEIYTFMSEHQISSEIRKSFTNNTDEISTREPLLFRPILVTYATLRESYEEKRIIRGNVFQSF